MRKILTAVLYISLIILVGGCQSAPDSGEPDKNPPPVNDSITLAGIGLGDSSADVMAKLGNSYHEEVLDDGGFFGEPTSRWTYGDDVELIIGEESQKVLQIKLSSDRFATNSGHKVGERAGMVLPGYEEKYPPAQDHFEGKDLPGWFVVAEGVWLIFDFEDDNALVNQSINADDQVNSIHLVYERFMD